MRCAFVARYAAVDALYRGAIRSNAAEIFAVQACSDADRYWAP